MLSPTDPLPRDPDLLIQLIADLKDRNARLEAEVAKYRRMVFGARSERMTAVVAEQGALDLGEVEAADGESANANDNTAPDGRSAGRSRRPARRNVGALPKHLPRVEQIIEPDTTQCPCCGGALHRIGEDVSEALDKVPAVLRVVRTVRPKYGCRTCEGAVVQAKAPARPVTGGMATTALIAHVVTAKYAWHLPLYRQVQIMLGQGVVLDRATLAFWVRRAAWWLRPLYEKLLGHIRSQPYILCDETPLPRLDPGRGRTKIGQLWAQAVDDRPWRGPSPPAIGYVYAEGRRAADISMQLASFSGVLQVDGYAAYKGLAKPGRNAGPIRLAFCLAHARRKFVDVHAASGSPVAREVISRIAEVYAIEAEIKGLSAAERLAVRQARSKPVMEALRPYLMAMLAEISQKSPLALAIRYTLLHWEGLCVYLEDGRVSVDTNGVERGMRPISLGKKNSLFAGSEGGGESWAILASLINTAKLNDLDPHTYLADALDRMVTGETTIDRLDTLLPWNWKADRAAVPAAA